MLLRIFLWRSRVAALSLARNMAEGGRKEEEINPLFGERCLDDPEEVFQHNSWDHIEWDKEQLRQAEEAIKVNSSQKLSDEEQRVLKSNISQKWDDFYDRHQTKFFKDRQWLFRLFPELLGKQDVPQSLLEVGCGVGNTVFPLLQTKSNLFIHCCDFSSTAIELVKANPLYDTRHCSAFVHDIAGEEPLPLPPNSIDLISLIFVMSAIPSERFKVALSKLVNVLRPGGKILFRDYGRLDLAQLRFKKGKCIGDDHYVRDDGTLSYFFTEEEVAALLEGTGLTKELLHTDKRLIVNRGKQLKMNRVWIIAKYCKLK